MINPMQPSRSTWCQSTTGSKRTQVADSESSDRRKEGRELSPSISQTLTRSFGSASAFDKLQTHYDLKGSSIKNIFWGVKISTGRYLLNELVNLFFSGGEKIGGLRTNWWALDRWKLSTLERIMKTNYLIPLLNPLTSINHHLKHAILETPMKETVRLKWMVKHIYKIGVIITQFPENI